MGKSKCKVTSGKLALLLMVVLPMKLKCKDNNFCDEHL